MYCRLKDLVEFRSGTPQFRIKEVTDPKAKSYTMYNQIDLQNDLSGGDFYNGDMKKIQTYDRVCLLEEGDIIFSLISGRAAIVRKQMEGYLYSQNYIKIDSRLIYPKFLVYYLNESKRVRYELTSEIKNLVAAKYTLKQLRELKIDLPLMEKQVQIGDLYFKQVKLNSLKKRLADNELKIVLEKLRKEIE